MRNLIVLIVLIMVCPAMQSQIFNVDYIYNPTSGNCVKERYQIRLGEDIYYRIDLYDNSKIWSPSRIQSTGYNDQDLYYEVWSPRFYLDMVGVDEYRRVYHYLVKVIYDRRGGDILYIIEQDLDSRDKRKRYFVTEIGSEYFCEN